MTEVSQISLSSNMNQNQSKQFSSQKFEQSTEGGQTSSRTFDSKSNVSKASILSHQIFKLEQAQTEMQKKFEKCIESLIKQIEQKQALNNKLLKEVSDLKQNVEESKKDIQVISGFVKKNLKSRTHPDNRLMTKNTAKNIDLVSSGKLFKRPLEERSAKKIPARALGGK